MPGRTGPQTVAAYRAVYGKGESWIGWSSEAEDAAWIKDTEFPDLPGSFIDERHYVAARGPRGVSGSSVAALFFAAPVLTRCSEPEHRWDTVRIPIGGATRNSGLLKSMM
jgi:hypothetical protein